MPIGESFDWSRFRKPIDLNTSFHQKREQLLRKERVLMEKARDKAETDQKIAAEIQAIIPTIKDNQTARVINATAKMALPLAQYQVRTEQGYLVGLAANTTQLTELLDKQLNVDKTDIENLDLQPRAYEYTRYDEQGLPMPIKKKHPRTFDLAKGTIKEPGVKDNSIMLTVMEVRHKTRQLPRPVINAPYILDIMNQRLTEPGFLNYYTSLQLPPTSMKSTIGPGTGPGTGTPPHSPSKGALSPGTLPPSPKGAQLASKNPLPTKFILSPDKDPKAVLHTGLTSRINELGFNATEDNAYGYGPNEEYLVIEEAHPHAVGKQSNVEYHLFKKDEQDDTYKPYKGDPWGKRNSAANYATLQNWPWYKNLK